MLPLTMVEMELVQSTKIEDNGNAMKLLKGRVCSQGRHFSTNLENAVSK